MASPDGRISLVDHTDDETTSSSPHPSAPSQPPPPRQPSSEIDVLYENQRGWFIFGIPLFSSSALWNLKLDQAAWVDSSFHPSAVNITNAQVPDPSWVWDWKSWYVDMSLDVDEEGWQYSFWFRGKTSWHGSHPWFHSFVRRRRWLRRRVKVDSKKRKGGKAGMFGDAFSVGAGSVLRTSTLGTSGLRGANEEVEEEEEILDVATLMRVLKRSAIDREKISAVNRFVETAKGEELFFLAEQMHAIMSLLLFQNSRLQLLSNLMNTIDTAQETRDEHKKNKQPEDSNEEQRINNLLKAVEAADAECKKLEYWSDIRKLAESGDAGRATDPKYGWDERWEGLDSSGAPHPLDRVKE